MDQLFIKVMEKNKEWNTFPFLLKYYNALEWEGRFTIDYIEKCFKQKLVIIKFQKKKKKKLSGHISLSTAVVELEGFKDLPFLKYNA